MESSESHLQGAQKSKTVIEKINHVRRGAELVLIEYLLKENAIEQLESYLPFDQIKKEKEDIIPDEMMVIFNEINEAYPKILFYQTTINAGVADKMPGEYEELYKKPDLYITKLKELINLSTD